MKWHELFRLSRTLPGTKIAWCGYTASPQPGQWEVRIVKQPDSRIDCLLCARPSTRLRQVEKTYQLARWLEDEQLVQWLLHRLDGAQRDSRRAAVHTRRLNRLADMQPPRHDFGRGKA